MDLSLSTQSTEESLEDAKKLDLTPESTQELDEQTNSPDATAEVERVLELTSEELLPSNTLVAQVADGTIFYVQESTSDKLYVKWKGKEVVAKLPEPKMLITGSFGNAIYFTTAEQGKLMRIYKAVFIPPRSITIIFLRDQMEGEEITKGGFCIRVRSGRKYFYRLCDDPEASGIDVSSDDPKWKRGGIHGARALYFKKTKTTHPSVVGYCDSNIELEILNKSYIFAKDHSPFIYILKTRTIYVINTRTMEMLRAIHLEGADSVESIAGVFHGTLHVKAMIGTDSHLMKARLPKGYYDKAMPVGRSMFNLDSKNDELSGMNDRHGFTSKFESEFNISKLLGAGAFGIVFEAENVYDNWKYGVKRISVDSKKHKIERALREVRAMAQLDHPGIIRYNSTWIETPPEEWQQEFNDDVLSKFPEVESQLPNHLPCKNYFIYIQMQLGTCSLSEWLKKEEAAKRNIYRIKTWFIQIVDAVEYIHSQNMIHRDLKPSNILFVERDRVKICDLGIARIEIDGDTTDPYTGVGTPLYMAPEQSSFIYDSKVDVFALGLIYSELCVAMTDSEKRAIFSEIRCGKPNPRLEDAPLTREFVAEMTKTDSEKRPSCNQLLKNSFINRHELSKSEVLR